MDTNNLSMQNITDFGNGASYFYLPKKDILKMLNPSLFRGSEVWCIYTTTIYERIEPDEFHSFVNEFFFIKKMKSMSSCVHYGLCCLLFRPHLMNEKDFQILKQALNSFEENILCFGYGRACLP